MNVKINRAKRFLRSHTTVLGVVLTIYRIVLMIVKDFDMSLLFGIFQISGISVLFSLAANIIVLLIIFLVLWIGVSIINYDFGQGYAHLFLNGIRIYGYDGNQKQLISSRSYYSQCFSEQYAKSECQNMVKEYLVGQMRLMGSTSINEIQLAGFASQVVGEALRNNPQRFLA